MNESILLELLQEASLARLDKKSLEKYANRYSTEGGTDRLLTDFAIFACNRFLSRDNSFCEVVSALNCLMATAGWGHGDAPLPFWEVFIAFDDFDVSEDPEEDARSRIERELARLQVVSRTASMTEERGYVLRRKNSRGEDEYIPIDVFTVEEYRCGLRAGDRLQLLRRLPGEGAGREIGGVWTVLAGSPQDPGALWLRQPDGKLHSWGDDETIFEYFEKVSGRGHR